MPKVFRVINRLNIGGPTFNAAYLSAYLPPQYETKLVSGMLAPGEESSIHVVEGLGIKPEFVLQMQREVSPRLDIKAYRHVKKLMADYHPDIVHTHAAKAGMLGRMAAMNLHVPVKVHTFHGHVFHSYFSKTKTQLFIQIERFLASVSDAIIALSPLQAHELTEVYNICKPEKIRIIPNGFDLSGFQQDQDSKRSTFRHQYGIADDTIAVGIIGRIAPIKNHRFFVEAFAALTHRTDKKIAAVIVGDGELRPETETLCESLGLKISTPEKPREGADVIFTSWIKDVSGPVAGMDIMALTSLNEGNPVALVEAQAGAKPSVSTDVGGVRDTMLHDESGYVTPPGDVAAFAQALQKLVEDDVLRKQFGETGRAFALKKFSYTRLVHDMDKLYDELLTLKT